MNRLRRLCAPAIALALGLVQTIAVAQGDARQRQRPPAPGPARPLQLPVARESRLANGVTLVLVEDHRAPLVTLVAGVAQRINWRHTVSEITNQMTLVEATADLLVEGQGEPFARGVEWLGAQVDANAGPDYAILSGVVIAENAEPMLALVADALARPKFLAREVMLYKNSRIDKLNVERQEPDFVVREHFNRLIFGAHPYAFSAPTPAAVRALSRARIEQFYKATYSPADTILIIVGDFDAARIKSQAQASLGRWRTIKRAAAGRHDHPIEQASALPPAATRRIYLIDRPGSAQASFRIGNLAVARGDKDYYAAEVANAILGDGTGSWLFQEIREQQGFAYDVASALSAMKTGGAFFGFAQSRTEVTAAAIKAMLAEFERLRDAEVSAEDLQNARHYLTGQFSLSLATQNGVAEELLTMKLMGLGADYLKDYRARIEAVTAADVQRVARRYVRTDDATVVVVGDAARLRDELAALGTVVLVNSKRAPR